MQVHTSTVAEQDFLFLNIFQAVTHLSVNRRLELSEIVKDLLDALNMCAMVVTGVILVANSISL